MFARIRLNICSHAYFQGRFLLLCFYIFIYLDLFFFNLDIKIIRNCFVPSCKSVVKQDVESLQEFINGTKILTVITGAGISTESGIPDYRSKTVGLYSRNGYRPMTYSQFLSSHHLRQRYWARNFLAWNYMYNRKPNASHLALTKWQKAGKMYCCVTQNIDRLHHKAGTESVIELHGNLYNVKCINCNYRVSRIQFQNILLNLNEHLFNYDSILNSIMSSDYYYFQKTLRPDGDIDIANDFMQLFKIPYCPSCNGILKPDVVFFGDSVSTEIVDNILEKINHSDSILVLGSSLMVYSSYRFILYAQEYGKNIAIVNIGPTKADGLKNVLKINSNLTNIITQIQV